MSLTLVSYTPNISSIPRRQYCYINKVTNVSGGMPIKSATSDNSSTFSQGRKEFLKVPTNTFYIKDKSIQCNTGVIRVDGTYNKDKNIESGHWSKSNHSISNRKRNQISCSGKGSNTCLLNGKKNNIMSSEELISRRRNNTIGYASSGIISNENDTKKYELSFNTMNIKNNKYTNCLVVNNAKQRTRNRGYVVPPKCINRNTC